MPEPRSIENVCEVRALSGPGTAREAPPDLLIEVPHGATKRRHYEAVRARLASRLPEGLESFFFVNTDVGAPECAEEVARRLVESDAMRALKVLIVRSLVPRTFIDCNRVPIPGVEPQAREGLTPLLPGYISETADIDLLRQLFDDYLQVVLEAYERTLGNGGLGLILHSCAPRSIRVDAIDGEIVKTMRRAYAPGVYERWPERPQVEIIGETEDGDSLAPPSLVDALHRRYAGIGIEVAENVSYRLDSSSMGWVHSARYPQRVLCMELNRALLADPFSPFEEMRIDPGKVRRLSGPIAEACEEWFGRPR